MSSSLRFLGVNAAGLGSKITTFKKVLYELKPSVFFVQETKLRNEGRLKLENYQVFELTRKKCRKGGIMQALYATPAWACCCQTPDLDQDLSLGVDFVLPL